MTVTRRSFLRNSAAVAAAGAALILRWRRGECLRLCQQLVDRAVVQCTAFFNQPGQWFLQFFQAFFMAGAKLQPQLLDWHQQLFQFPQHGLEPSRIKLCRSRSLRQIAIQIEGLLDLLDSFAHRLAACHPV